LSPSLFGSAEAELTGSWQPDPARAAAILDRKGWSPGPDGVRAKDGKRLAISFIDTQGNREQRLDVIQLVRRQLARNGIALSIDSEPAGAYAQKVSVGEYDLTGGAQFADDPDVLRRYYVPSERSSLSGTRVDDPELSQWLQQAAAEADETRRATLYRLAQRKIIEKVYAIPIYVLLYNIASAGNVTGIAIDSHGFPHFHGARLAET
jgi:peptide/nickel transport system substrate-binding protein